MKKAYIAYLVVMSLFCAIAVGYLVKQINTAKAGLTAATEKAAEVETAISNAETQVTQPVTTAEASKPASAGPFSAGIAAAHAQKPKPAPKPAPLPGAGASVDAGGAPSCADLSGLRQAVNPNPRATQYRGQLLIGNGTGAKLRPCTQARSFGNTGEQQRAEKLAPGQYVHPTLGKFSIGR